MKLLCDEKYYNDVNWNKDQGAYQLIKQYDDEDNLQTIWMEFGLIGWNREDWRVDTLWFNVALSIYNKRKDLYDNMDKKISTGKDLIRNFIVARKMFDALEAAVVEDAVRNKKDIIIYACWEDNRRRDAYYRVLSRKGYKYGISPYGNKIIMKKFKWKDYKEMVIEENE